MSSSGSTRVTSGPGKASTCLAEKPVQHSCMSLGGALGKGVPEMAWNVKMTDSGATVSNEGLSIDLPQEVLEELKVTANKAATSEAGELVLDETHPMWDHHSGGDRHTGNPWVLPEALMDAKTERRYLPNKAKAFFELLLSKPGRLFSSDEIIEALPEHFSSALAIAGSLNGFVKPANQNGRPFPFFWWEGAEGKPTRYAVRPSVANVFIAAGD